jgi:alpha-amylase/alpha-mannosidase (GH57 family)
LKVCILWHMHQPDYRPPGGGRSIMPWVRLHAAKDYMDMTRLAEEAPDHVRVTFNWTPCLLDQLDDLARGKLDDEFLALTRKEARDLNEAERLYALRHFFSASEERQIRTLPRYHELRVRRDAARTPARLLQSFSDEDFRDLAALFHLAWSGSWLRREPAIRELLAKGRGYSEADKRTILDAHEAQAREILPLVKKLAAAGKIELSTTPLYHPILPLLVDLKTAGDARSGCSTGGVSFSKPQDARAQVDRGLDLAERLLGTRPRGMWPSEGSISEAVVGIVEHAGIAWLGADEQVLRKSLERHHESPHLRPWRLGGRGPAIFFRDTALSDLIGFTYSRQDGERAAEDFTGRVVRLAASHDEPGEPIVNVILDGENAWEYYAENGSLFLRALYRKLGATRGLETTTFSRALESARPGTLSRLSPGSWIRGDFDTWAGHDEKNRAWGLLSAVRREVDDAGPWESLPAEVRETVYRAEGSDWFWWLGDDHPTAYLSEFESLFRQNLRFICERLGRRPPAGLDEPIPRRRSHGAAFETPYALITPRIDGRADRYYEWVGSGLHHPDDGGAMRPGAPPIVRELRFGFDREKLYVRLEPDPARKGELAAARARITIEPIGNGNSPRVYEWTREGGLGPATPGAEAACDRVFELALPRDAVGLGAGARARLSVELALDEDRRERLPREGEVELLGPDEAWDLRHWTL